MIIQHILIGALLVGLGTALLKYNYQLVGWTGNIEWVERYMGSGSTYLFLKLLAVLICIGGFLYMTGLLLPLVTTLTAPLAGFFSGGS